MIRLQKEMHDSGAKTFSFQAGDQQTQMLKLDERSNTLLIDQNRGPLLPHSAGLSLGECGAGAAKSSLIT